MNKQIISQNFLQGILDGLPFNIAILDETGVILFVNQSWRQFAQANGMKWPRYGLGYNYLDAITIKPDQSDTGSAAAADGIRTVMSGESDSFAQRYSFLSPDVERWFMMRVTRFTDDDQARIIVTHTDITEQAIVEQELKDGFQFEKLISHLSAQFITLSIGSDANEKIVAGLRLVAVFLGADCAGLHKLTDDKLHIQPNLSWTIPNLELPATDTITNYQLDWIRDQITTGQSVVMNLTNVPPTDLNKDKQILQKSGVKSVMVLPLLIDKIVVGALSFVTLREPRNWTSQLAARSQLIAEIFANALLRQRAEAELHKYRAQLEERVAARTAELSVAKEQAEAASRAKGSFLANMSHELRTPLTAIIGFAQLLENAPQLDDKQRRYLATINESGNHLLNLINEILEMAKIEAGRILLNKACFDLHQTLARLINMMMLAANQKDLQIYLERDTAVPRYIKTDQGKLRQVLINLLSNAIKYTDTGTVSLQVTVGQSLPDGWHLQFAVADTGRGIAPEDLDSLFIPFAQTQAGKPTKMGTGLGLPISKEYVNLMGGDITVETQLNQGTTFRFDILANRTTGNALVQSRQPHVIGLAPDQPQYRILVVEDQPDSRELLYQLLTDAGFSVRLATNGEEAIAQFERWQPHLIWMDMRMPVMSGQVATQQIKAMPHGQQTPIIALTASAFEEDRAKFLASGCDDFVRKPFQEAEIFNKIALHLDVKYLYSKDTESPQLEVAKDEQWLLASLARVVQDPAQFMAKDWLAELSQAATKARGDQVLRLLQAIEASHLELAHILSRWALEFKYDKIVTLIEQYNGDNQHGGQWDNNF